MGYDMGTLLILPILCEKNHQSLVDFPDKGPVMQILTFSLLLAWTRYWTNSQIVDDLWHHDTHVCNWLKKGEIFVKHETF